MKSTPITVVGLSVLMGFALVTTAAQEAPAKKRKRSMSDAFWTVSAAATAVPGESAFIPGFGSSLRFESNAWVIDGAAQISFEPDIGDHQSTLYVVTLGLGVMRFLDPGGDASFYLGGGLGWGARAVPTDAPAVGAPGYQEYSGAGLESKLSVGYELFRTGDVRLFSQLDVGIPFYILKERNDPKLTLYRPSTTLLFGLAFDPPEICRAAGARCDKDAECCSGACSRRSLKALLSLKSKECQTK